ncbi:hypothetical protein OAI26_02850 [Sulfitobacter sp.]|nr:hypothetical protein [bacterium]MDC0135600.1 hypothetical protein [Sulfitobacter sp.]
MSRKARLFELMVKREKIELRLKSETLTELINDYDTMQKLDQKLSKMLEANHPEQGPQSVHALRSKAWYGCEMAQQQEFTSSRLEFLGQEIITNRNLLAQNKHKERIISDRALQERKAALTNNEDQAEKLLPPRNRSERS